MLCAAGSSLAQVNPLPLVQRAPVCFERRGLRPRGGRTARLSRRPGQHPFRGAGCPPVTVPVPILFAGRSPVESDTLVRLARCRARAGSGTRAPTACAVHLRFLLGRSVLSRPGSAPDRNVQRPRSPITAGGTQAGRARSGPSAGGQSATSRKALTRRKLLLALPAAFFRAEESAPWSPMRRTQLLRKAVAGTGSV